MLDLQKLKMEENNVFFNAGDVVTLRQDISNKPQMVVVKKVTAIFKNETDKKSILKCIKCMWFTEAGALQEYIFNTKDLKKV